jgi:SAM-dependent methyltransferase
VEQATFQREFYDKHFARRAEVLKEQVHHPLFCSWYDRLAGKAYDAVGNRPHVRLLEVATGEGLWANALHRVAAERGITLTYTGTDLSEAAIEQTSAAVPGTFLPGDCVETVANLEPASQDLIVVKNLLHHIDNPADLLTAAKRALAPDGVVLVVEACLASPWLWGFIALAPRRERYFFQGRKRNAKAIADAGLTIQREEKWSSLPYEMLFTIRWGQFRRLLERPDPGRIERISRWDDAGAKAVPALASYRIWELRAPTT